MPSLGASLDDHLRWHGLSDDDVALLQSSLEKRGFNTVLSMAVIDAAMISAMRVRRQEHKRVLLAIRSAVTGEPIPEEFDERKRAKDDGAQGGSTGGSTGGSGGGESKLSKHRGVSRNWRKWDAKLLGLKRGGVRIGLFPTEEEAVVAVAKAEALLAEGVAVDDIIARLKPVPYTDRSTFSSTTKGVSWDSRMRKWQVKVKINGAPLLAAAFFAFSADARARGHLHRQMDASGQRGRRDCGRSGAPVCQGGSRQGRGREYRQVRGGPRCRERLTNAMQEWNSRRRTLASSCSITSSFLSYSRVALLGVLYLFPPPRFSLFLLMSRFV